jgi:flavin reductase (DIM6/NTAB) family NADH-FMN oxidoreductase RutF
MTPDVRYTDIEHTVIDSGVFRSTLGSFATGVVVITASGAGGALGMAVNSFTTVSLDPPLVLFCAAHSSMTWPRIRAAGRFCANVLASGQTDVARRFAGPGDRYHEVGHSPGISGSPVLVGAHAFVECVLVEEHDAGDHTIVLGRVVALGADESNSPLVFHRGRFHGSLEA